MKFLLSTVHAQMKMKVTCHILISDIAVDVVVDSAYDVITDEPSISLMMLYNHARNLIPTLLIMFMCWVVLNLLSNIRRDVLRHWYVVKNGSTLLSKDLIQSLGINHQYRR